jgi:hypothetical protein
MFEQFSLWSMKITRPCIYPTLKEIAIIPVQNSFVQIGMKARGNRKTRIRQRLLEKSRVLPTTRSESWFRIKNYTVRGFQHRE